MSKLSDFLRGEVVRVTTATPESTKTLTELITTVDDDVVKHESDRVPKWSEADEFGGMTRIDTEWSKIYFHHTAATVFRLATFDLESLESLVPTQNDPRTEDGAGSPQRKPHERLHAPVGYMKDQIYSYLKAVLDGPLKSLKAEALDIASTSAGYQAVGTLDYYRDRSVDTHVFHKDTAGTTLFVALHYLNAVKLLGAEYIYDTKPNKAKEWGTIVSDEERGRTTAKRPDRAWPLSLEQAMSTARATLPLESRPTIHCNEIDPNGILTFVDELIYHASPFAGKRPDHAKKQKNPFPYGDYLSVSLTNSVTAASERFSMRDDVRIDKPKKKFVRTVSKEKLSAPAQDLHGKRRFARLWICIQPKNWTTPA